MKLFDENACLTDEGLHALIDGSLDEMGRLEAAEHLAYCDRCMDRYTALLCGDVLEQPPQSLAGPVVRTLWVRVMQNTYGRAAVAGVAAVIALTMWRGGAFNAKALRSTVESTRPAAAQSNMVSQFWSAAESFVDTNLTQRLYRTEKPKDTKNTAPQGDTAQNADDRAADTAQ